MTKSSECDILYPLAHLIATLRLATEESIPNYKPKIALGQLRRRPWTENIHQTIRNCRLAWWKWKKAGAPQDSTNPYVQQRKAAKRSLRKEQRKEAASLRKQKVEQIMEAEGDSRTFFKLVGQQRRTASQQTGTLRVDGEPETPTKTSVQAGPHTSKT